MLRSSLHIKFTIPLFPLLKAFLTWIVMQSTENGNKLQFLFYPEFESPHLVSVVFYHLVWQLIVQFHL